jgi:hypothetical protein
MGILDMFGVGPIADLASKILDFFPNAADRQKAAEMLQDFQTKVAEGQNATNAAEAATGNLFIAGWRPALGWVLTIGFTYSLVAPVLHLPSTDNSMVNNMLYGMLGLGTMRSAEKLGGVATAAIKKLIR